jgi:D-3-phosphoglycerate dehydrogenase
LSAAPGIGLDNVDVAEATRRGVMVVNAPQSNILSAAEHTLALLLSQARNVPQANADLKSGKWNRSKWEGVELHGKTLGIVGLGRVGVLVAQRAYAFGMRLVAYDPFVSADRARQLGVQLVPTVEELVAICDFVSIHATKTPDTIGLINADVLAHAKPGMRLINAGRGGIVDEAALAAAIADGRLGGAGIDTFAAEPTTESDLFGLDNVVVTPHLGASTVEAQDKAGETIAEQVILALRGDFVPFAVNVAASEASESVRPFLPLAERVGRLFTGLAGGAPSTLEVTYEGEIADYDCRVLTLSVLKGVLTPVVDEPVSFVNAPQIAEQRGISVRETKSSDARDYVNLIVVRGDQGTHVAATLFGKQQAPRIVGIDGHQVDLAAGASSTGRAQRRRARGHRPGHVRARCVGYQHLRHPRRAQCNRRSRTHGHRDRLTRTGRDRCPHRRATGRAIRPGDRSRLSDYALARRRPSRRAASSSR